MKLSHIFRASLSSVLLAGGVIHAFAESETITKLYDVSPTGSVSVENVNGKITVTAWDGDGVSMEAVKSANSREGLDGIKINVKSSDSRLEIITRLPKTRGWFGRTKTYGAKVDYLLRVPPSIKIRRAASVNGSVSIDGVQGGVWASTVNGRIVSSGVNGTIELSTVNGSVTCETSTQSASDSIDISTVNGGVVLGLLKSVDADLKATTVNGSIKSEFALSKTEMSGHRKLRGVIGDGGLPVAVTTVNGSIRLRKTEAVTVSPRRPRIESETR